MRVVGIISAFVLLGGILVGAGYGATSMVIFLYAQWGSLTPDWKAGLIVMSTILVLCTLFASLFLRAAMKNFGLKGPGKVMAYNDFVHWYSAIKNDDAEAMKSESIKVVTNQMILWGSKQVARQATLLCNMLQKDEVERDQVLKKAEHVYIEIRRELGNSGTSRDNAIF